MNAVESALYTLSRSIGAITALLLFVLVCNVAYDVFTRYALNDVSIGMQELEWHLFSIIFLLGTAYASTENAHVRVDFLYDNASAKTQGYINIIGTVLFVIPFALLIFWYGVDFTVTAYVRGEQSGDPGGLPHRWLIKSMIPLAMLLLVCSYCGVLLRTIRTIKNPS